MTETAAQDATPTESYGNFGLDDGEGEGWTWDDTEAEG
jgi:hypothetical protein